MEHINIACRLKETNYGVEEFSKAQARDSLELTP